MQLILVFLAVLASVNASGGAALNDTSVGVATKKSSGKLLVWKDYVSKYPVANQENVFEYLLINIGDTKLVNVELDDRKSFPTNRFEIRKGSTLAKFASIAPGANVTHHVVVVPIEPQPFGDKDVRVSYTDSKSGKTSTMSTVSNEKNYRFLSEREMHMATRTRKAGLKYFLGFFAISFATTAVPALLYHISACRYPPKTLNQ